MYIYELNVRQYIPTICHDLHKMVKYFQDDDDHHHRKSESFQMDPLLESGELKPLFRRPFLRFRSFLLWCGATIFVLLLIKYSAGAVKNIDPYLFSTSLRGASSSQRQQEQQEWVEIKAKNVPLPHVYDGEYTANPINSTLGFEKILVINLPHRHDKKDELVMISNVYGLNLTFIETKLISELKESGLPYSGDLDRGAVGVFRAHADAWQRLLTENWSSALIFEDDADWDIDLRYAIQQLHQPLARLLKSVNNTEREIVSTREDPWMSSEWDMLNLGLCLEAPFTEAWTNPPLGSDFARPPHIMYEDKTMPFHNDEQWDQVNYFKYYGQSFPKPGDKGPKRRMVSLMHTPVCLNAYAISRRGALKLLYYSTRRLYAAIDNIIGDLTASGRITAYGTIPLIMSQFRQKDANVLQSDNRMSNASPEELAKFKAEQALHEKEINHNPSVGDVPGIVNSLRRAMPEILADPNFRLPYF